jgi:hypothetical protein
VSHSPLTLALICETARSHTDQVIRRSDEEVIAEARLIHGMNGVGSLLLPNEMRALKLRSLHRLSVTARLLALAHQQGEPEHAGRAQEVLCILHAPAGSEGLPLSRATDLPTGHPAPANHTALQTLIDAVHSYLDSRTYISDNNEDDLELNAMNGKRGERLQRLRAALEYARQIVDDDGDPRRFDDDTPYG